MGGCCTSAAVRSVQPAGAAPAAAKAWENPETPEKDKPAETAVKAEKAAEPKEEKPAEVKKEPEPALPGAVASSVELHKVSLDEAGFAGFVARMPDVTRETLMCAWSDLAEVTELCAEEDAPMRDFQAWAVGSSDLASADAFCACCIKEGASFHVAVVLCLGTVDVENMASVVSAIRSEILRTMNVGAVRLTMWYRDVDGTFAVDKDLQDKVKSCGFRWFQLTNTADQRRGVVMQTRRVVPPDGDDPVAPE